MALWAWDSSCTAAGLNCARTLCVCVCVCVCVCDFLRNALSAKYTEETNAGLSARNKQLPTPKEMVEWL